MKRPGSLSMTAAVAELQQQFERQLQPWLEDYRVRGGRIWCGSGCQGCCNLHVETSLAEVLLLVRDDLNSHAITARADYLRRAAGEAESFRAFLWRCRQQGHCPLLDADGRCGVYPQRPLSCRALYSTRPPSWCEVDFATLHPLEREAFISGLDTDQVAWPSHYLASPQHSAAELQPQLRELMLEAWGCEVRGALAVLLHLEIHHDLSHRLISDGATVSDWLSENGWGEDYLIQILGKGQAGPEAFDPRWEGGS